MNDRPNTTVAHRVRAGRSATVLVAGVIAVLVGLLAVTTAVAASTYGYDDALSIARGDDQTVGTSEASSTRISAAPEEFASPPVEARGASTTSSGSFIATEAAPTVRHYTTSEFAESISKGGEITPGLSSGKTWLTPDEYLYGATAQSRLALNKTPDGYFEIPMCRVSCPSSPSRVQPYNGQPGGGIEITTNSPIDVTGLPFIPFGPR